MHIFALALVLSITAADAFVCPHLDSTFGQHALGQSCLIHHARLGTRLRKMSMGVKTRKRTRFECLLKDKEEDKIRILEDEIRDNTGAISYVFPRPLRKVVWGVLAANSFWGALVLGGRYAAEGLEKDLSNVVGNLEAAAALAAILAFEFWDEKQRRDFRNLVAKKQVEIGDREIVKKFDESSGKVRSYTKLKPVDDDWILRRIDRWGIVETATTRGNPLPTVGPAKGKILEELVAKCKPKLIVDIGTFVGYAAIRMGRRQEEGALTITIEKEFRWWVSASRFVWQANMWQQYPWEPAGKRRVRCLLGDALEKMPEIARQYGPADVIFIDGKPSEYLEYLKVAEACGLVRSGTTVIADNAEVFKHLNGVKEYLSYVRASDRYESQTIMSTLEYRDDTPDALEKPGLCITNLKAGLNFGSDEHAQLRLWEAARCDQHAQLDEAALKCLDMTVSVVAHMTCRGCLRGIHK